MEDICIFCTERLATVTFNACGHRQYCAHCYQRTTQGGLKNCPICYGQVTAVQDSTAVQLRKTTLNDSLSLYDDLRQDYPYGCLLFNDRVPQELIATPDVQQVVRQAMEAVTASRLDFRQLKVALKERLTVAQYQLVFVELIKDENLHGVLKQLDSRKFERRSITRSVQEMVVCTIESPNNLAIASRAAIGTTGSAVFDLATKGISGFANASAAGCAVSNGVMFAIFSAVELYRWSKGADGCEVAKNIGEHAVGSLYGFGGGYLGSLGGAAVGATIGSVVPIVGTVIGGVIGGIIGTLFGGLVCDAAGRWFYRKLLPRKETAYVDTDENVERQITPEEVAKKAAETFGINLQLDSFEEAHARFRRRLLKSHPDKHPDASQEERERLTAETTDILACWLIVRENYNDRGQVEGADCEEGFIRAFALKVFEAATNQWRVARTYFHHVKLDRDIDPVAEKIEAITFYV